MIGRRSFIQGIGAAFLCLGLGLRLGAGPVKQRWEAVPGSYPFSEIVLYVGGARITGFHEGDELICIGGGGGGGKGPT